MLEPIVRDSQIQGRRGTHAELDVYILAAGEFGFETDTNDLYLGNGVDAGGTRVALFGESPTFAAITTDGDAFIHGTMFIGTGGDAIGFASVFSDILSVNAFTPLNASSDPAAIRTAVVDILAGGGVGFDFSGGGPLLWPDGLGDLVLSSDGATPDRSFHAMRFVGDFIGGICQLRTTASDPKHATPGSRPAGVVAEIAYYSGKLYFCTNAVTPTWELITSI